MKIPLTLRDHLDRAAAVYPNRVAFIDEPTQAAPPVPDVTYARLSELARAQGAALDALGVGFGARVAVVSHNATRLGTAFFGVTTNGRVLVPVNFRLARDEIARLAPAHQGANAALLRRAVDGAVIPLGELEEPVLGGPAHRISPAADSDPGIIGGPIESLVVMRGSSSAYGTAPPSSGGTVTLAPPSRSGAHPPDGMTPPAVHHWDGRAPGAGVPPSGGAGLRLWSNGKLYHPGVAVTHSPAVSGLAAPATVRLHPDDDDADRGAVEAGLTFGGQRAKRDANPGPGGVCFPRAGACICAEPGEEPCHEASDIERSAFANGFELAPGRESAKPPHQRWFDTEADNAAQFADVPVDQEEVWSPGPRPELRRISPPPTANFAIRVGQSKGRPPQGQGSQPSGRTTFRAIVAVGSVFLSIWIAVPRRQRSPEDSGWQTMLRRGN